MTTHHSKNQRVGNYQPLPCQPTTPQRQGLVGQAPPKGGPANLPTPDGAGLVKGLAELPNIERLRELRTRLNDGVAYCRAHANDLHRQHYQRGVKRAVRLLASEYMPLIRQLRDAYSDDELRGHAAHLEGRLEKGWGMEATEKRDDLFQRLLTEYEVIVDALDDGTQSREFVRINGPVA